MTSPKAAKKDRYGTRYYPIPGPDGGEPVDLLSVTAIQKILAAPALETWKIKTVASWLARRQDLVALAGIDPYKAAKQALDAEQSAANVGTAVHGYTEAADDGTLDIALVPDGARNHIAHYLNAKLAHKWTVVESEVTVFNHTVGYAGTLDRILDLPGAGRVMCDIKTGKGVYADTALQLAFYANSEGIWDADTQTRRPLPDGLRTDIGYVIHLRDTGCQLVPLDLDGAWPVCQAIAVIGGWQKRKGIVGKPVDPETTTPALRDRLTNEIRQLPAQALAELAANWPADIPTLKTDHDHSDLELSLIQQVLNAVASIHNVPFPETIEEQQPRPLTIVPNPRPEIELSDQPAPKETRDQIIERLKALDGDLLAEITAKANTASIPNLKTPNVLNAHIDYLTIYLEQAEQTQQQRRQADVFVS